MAQSGQYMVASLVKVTPLASVDKSHCGIDSGRLQSEWKHHSVSITSEQVCRMLESLTTRGNLRETMKPLRQATADEQ